MDENTIFDKVHDIDLKKTMENSYIDYAMSVIASRALPDVRDGLKPVQRRILYAMIELNNGPDKPHRKCARIVGDTMGKYHPHGDSSIYGALVNMAQEWSTRYPLVDGHGNFGSVDGDGAAAMRYTEARLSKISMELLADINKNTVDFRPNFDETEKEPAVLPSRFPNLLVNGTQGIAVGMATNIPPHNLREVINAVIKIIDNQVEEDRETTIEELLEIIKGPDFPTGATILGRSGIDQAYRTGRGKIKVRAVTDIEAMANGKQRIIVTELPYMVNKARLIEKIATLVREKKVEGITELRDESDRSGMRICIELRRDANANVILNQLYKHTQLQDTFGVIMLALVDGQPKTMNLHEMLDYYLETGQFDEAYSRAQPLINKQITCYEANLRAYLKLAYYAQKAGKPEIAADMCARAEEALVGREKDEYLLLYLGLFIAYNMMTKPERAWEYAERCIGWSLRTNTLKSYRFSCDMVEALKYETRPEVSLSLPEEFPLYRPDGIYQVNELRNYFYQQAEELARRYDARNGNSGYMDRLKDLMSN